MLAKLELRVDGDPGKMGSQYSDVYVNNQTACIADSGYNLEMKDVGTISKASFYERGYLCTPSPDRPEILAELRDDQYSGTPLIRRPRGHAKMSVLAACPMV